MNDLLVRAFRLFGVLCLAAVSVSVYSVTAFAQDAEPKGDDAEETAVVWNASKLSERGLSDSFKEYGTQPATTFWFFTRGDEVLTGARLKLFFNEPGEKYAHLISVTVSVNDEKVKTLEIADIAKQAEHQIAIDSRLLTDQNALTLEIKSGQTDECGGLPVGSWGIVEEGILETRGSAMPLQNSLALLPLPFYDVNYDRGKVAVPVAIMTKPTPGVLRAASLVAAYFGLQAGSKATFPTQIETLPEGRAVVLAIGALDVGGLTLEEPTGPVIRMIDHPAYEKSNRKLLVLHGRDEADLQKAAEALAQYDGGWEGDNLAIKDTPLPPARKPYDSPRWLPPKPLVAFGEIPGGRDMVHKGLRGGTLEIAFRISPDLFAWPTDRVRIDLDYKLIAPSPDLVPWLIVELNGQYVTRLHRPKLAEGIALESQTIELHRTQLRGYNSLKVHISWPKRRRYCNQQLNDNVQISIAPSSKIHFENIPHFTQLPNIQLMVDDGYPFTRYADLGDTSVLLPKDANPKEVETLLSLMAHFAAVTGYSPLRANFGLAEDMGQPQYSNREILAIGQASRLPMMGRWSEHLPLVMRAGMFMANEPPMQRRVLALLGGHRISEELKKVSAILAQTEHVSAAMQMRSPYHNEKSAILVTANSAEAMPVMGDFIGYTIATQAGGDLMLATQTNRWRFWIHGFYDVGELDWFTRLRWVLASHWLILIPSMILAALLLSPLYMGYLRGRERQRLVIEAGESD